MYKLITSAYGFTIFFILMVCFSCNSKAINQPPLSDYCEEEFQQIKKLLHQIQYKDTARLELPLGDIAIQKLIESSSFKFIETEKGRKYLTAIDLMLDDSLILRGDATLSNFAYLKAIDIKGQDLDSLYISDCPVLEKINCASNNLSVVQIKKCDNVKYLELGNNNLTDIDLSSLLLLKTLGIGYNHLTNIDVKQNKELFTLDLSNNLLVNVSFDLPKLDALSVSNNKLTTIDTQHLPLLKELILYSNKLSTIDTQANQDLEKLDVSDNELSAINLEYNPKIKELNVGRNKFVKLDLSKVSSLESLECYTNSWQTLEPASYKGKNYFAEKTYGLISLVLPNKSKLKQLNCSNNILAQLDLTKSPYLEEADFSSNAITAIDLTNNKKLIKLDCSGNKLTSLDLSANTRLEDLSCYSNRLTQLDLRAHASIKKLASIPNPFIKLMLHRNISSNEELEIADTSCMPDMRSLINTVLPEVIKYDAMKEAPYMFKSDTLAKYAVAEALIADQEDGSNPTWLMAEQSSVLAIGKFLGNFTTAILYCSDIQKVEFYRLHQQAWKKIGESNDIGNDREISFQKLINAPEPIIVFSSHPNMNGNRWSEAYKYKAETDRINFAGDFCTDYNVQLSDSTITEEYGGSWYMPNHKILYKWSNDTIIPLRKTVLELVTADMISDEHYILYYENLTNTYDGLKLIFKELYDENNKKHRQYWDGFFSIGRDR